MGQGSVGFVGRARELADLRAGVDEALAGRGAVWLLCGEPGIGKSRLADEVARGTRGAAVLWGRSWEAGGAPAYWPWTQVLRALFRRRELRELLSGERAAVLAQLVPELAPDRAPRLDGALDGAPALPPEHARFQLMEAVAAALCDASAEQPLLLVFEDLHAADGASLLLLDFVAHQIYGSPIAVIGTFRDAEATRVPPLARLGQEARTIALGRFGADEVRALLEQVLGAPPPDAMVERAALRTEGNPLFLVELARLLVTQGDTSAVPGTLRTALRQRQGQLAPEVNRALELAAVVGREARVDLLARTAGLSVPALTHALDEACAAAFMAPLGPGLYRFTHILVREVIHDAIPPEERRALHLAVAEALRRAGGEPSWSEIAHHSFAAGEPGLAAALEATERAAAVHLHQLAFEEAIAAFERALDALARARDPSPVRRAEILLALGHARLRSGDVDGGRRTCLAAAELARQLGDFDLFARAALELGSVFHFGHVQPGLAGLLEEALDRLDPADSSLRARVMARLAAAQQPALDPLQPLDLGREAIAMARRAGDEDALLAVLRAAGSAMVDLVDPVERIQLDRELVELAGRRGERADQVRGQLRLVADCYELADPAGAAAAMAAVRRLAADLGHAWYLWQARSLDALEALVHGRLVEASQAIDDAEELGRVAGDPNARACAMHQRVQLLALRGERDPLVALVAPLARLFGDGIGAALGALSAVIGLLHAGRVDEAARRATPEVVDILLGLRDRSAFLPLAELAAATRDRDLAARLLAVIEPVGDQVAGLGAARILLGPMARGCAMSLRALGRMPEARRWQERALARSIGLASPPMEAVDRLLLAEFMSADGDAAGAREERAAAQRLIDAHGMVGLAPAQDVAAPAILSPARVSRFALVREGDAWRVDCDGESFHIKELKGLQILARLIEQPGRELHVVDLVGSAAEIDEARDGGDAGELLDRRARDDYRRRLADLEERLAEAGRNHDVGRAAGLRAELEFLEAELSRAVGLGGRARRAGSAVERARVNVQRRLREAIRRLGLHSPRLGRHLENSVRTGTYCSYAPE